MHKAGLKSNKLANAWVAFLIASMMSPED